jgi:hypothetical protein
MVRFGNTDKGYPPAFLAGFRGGFAANQPYEPPADWAYLGRVLDMFSLSGLVSRPAGHPVADQAAGVIREWLATGVPTD